MSRVILKAVYLGDKGSRFLSERRGLRFRLGPSLLPAGVLLFPGLLVAFVFSATATSGCDERFAEPFLKLTQRVRDKFSCLKVYVLPALYYFL